MTLFCAALLLNCWLGMQAIHEFGHIVGAVTTGGSIECVVLHPLAISRTDVSPNPLPGVVAWMGPVLGCVIPLAIAFAAGSCSVTIHSIARFFAGFCLIANGAYISVGSFDQVGDCREMMATGSPHWVLLGFGAVTIPAGLFHVAQDRITQCVPKRPDRSLAPLGLHHNNDCDCDCRD